MGRAPEVTVAISENEDVGIHRYAYVCVGYEG